MYSLTLCQLFLQFVGRLCLSWQLSFGILVLLYFYSYYFFASGTAHIGAMFTAFLSIASRDVNGADRDRIMGARPRPALWVGSPETALPHMSRQHAPPRTRPEEPRPALRHTNPSLNRRKKKFQIS